jgi:serine/threonine protein kinase
MPETGSLPPPSFVGDYQLDRELGRGGMAAVYFARDLKHERPVAFQAPPSRLDRTAA